MIENLWGTIKEKLRELNFDDASELENQVTSQEEDVYCGENLGK